MELKVWVFEKKWELMKSISCKIFAIFSSSYFIHMVLKTIYLLSRSEPRNTIWARYIIDCINIKKHVLMWNKNQLSFEYKHILKSHKLCTRVRKVFYVFLPHFEKLAAKTFISNLKIIIFYRLNKDFLKLNQI